MWTKITPYRVDNLLETQTKINFEYVDEWIIVYSKIKTHPNWFVNQEN